MPPQVDGDARKRVIMVGVGGVSCSGKTTLAKHLRDCLPDSFVVHQDDFAPPRELIPIHPVYKIQDWDDAPGAVLWPKMAEELEYVRRTGAVSDQHFSHDQMNEQKDVPVDGKVFQRWKTKFRQITAKYADQGEKVQWVVVDGFLLYWHPEVFQALDVRIFIRENEDVVRQRRASRDYHTAALDPVEGHIWSDPPNYWENIVWPAYVRAHQGIFKDGDVEHGLPNGKVPDLFVLDGEDWNMTEIFERACDKIIKSVVAAEKASEP